jgi:hypothetical protein
VSGTVLGGHHPRSGHLSQIFGVMGVYEGHPGAFFGGLGGLLDPNIMARKVADERRLREFIDKQGIDKKKFIDTFNSFSVQSKVNRVRQLMEAYRIDGVPTVVIDGQYITSPSIVGSALRGQSEQALNAATLQVMDALLAKKK